MYLVQGTTADFKKDSMCVSIVTVVMLGQIVRDRKRCAE